MKQLGCLGLLLILVSGLYGCASDEAKEIPPAELNDIKEDVVLKQIWKNSIGDGQGEKSGMIRPAVAGNTIYAASADGVVEAFDRISGDEQWKIDLEIPLSGGVGAMGDIVVVSAASGEVIALKTNDGSSKWRTPVSSEVISVPLVNADEVVVQCNDDAVTALDSKDGKIKWMYKDTSPSLSVRGTAAPVYVDGAIVVGLSNAKLAVLDAKQGTEIWAHPVGVSEGRSELDRLVDIDGSPKVSGDNIFVGNYQGHVSALDLHAGQIKWQQELSTLSAVDTDEKNVYATSVDGHVSALDQQSGSPVWTLKDLDRRLVTAPEVIKNDYVAVADFEGYVHVLANKDGRIVGRERADSDGVRVQPLAVDDVLYVYGNSGDLVAYQMTK